VAAQSGRSTKLTTRRRYLHTKAYEHNPVTLNHAEARYDWLQAIARSNFSPTVRLVGHTPCLHGSASGGKIYPTTQTLARESGLSERSVCTAIETLSCGGYLWPDFMPKRHGQSWALTIYKLLLPTKVWESVSGKPWRDEPTWKPEQGMRGTERTSVPSVSVMAVNTGNPGASTALAPESPLGHPPVSPGSEGTETGAQGTETGAEGTERHDRKALNQVQSSLPSESLRVVSQSECAQTRTTHAPEKLKSVEKAEATDDATKKAAVLLLLNRGIDETEIPRLLRARGVTREDVQRIAQSARAA
jgi:hypothetical protein